MSECDIRLGSLPVGYLLQHPPAEFHAKAHCQALLAQCVCMHAACVICTKWAVPRQLNNCAACQALFLPTYTTKLFLLTGSPLVSLVWVFLAEQMPGDALAQPVPVGGCRHVTSHLLSFG